MVQWVLERLAPQVGAVLISANRNLPRYAGRLPRAARPAGGFAGPLAGLQAALAQATTPLLVTAPCDSPFLPADLVARLHDALVAQQAELAVACAGGRAHRAFCLLRRELLPRSRCLPRRRRTPGGLWHAALKVVEVDFSDEAAAFGNINTADDLARFAK
jgi:molybdopterin-guanine dinucleotide biosynthesis protein A